MFVGNIALSCEDNILTLINELFTGQLPPIKSGGFSFSCLRKQASGAGDALAASNYLYVMCWRKNSYGRNRRQNVSLSFGSYRRARIA